MRVIAELGQTMHGDVYRAVDAVDAFAEAGATGIKVQLLTPETIATADATNYWRTDGVEGSINQREAFARWGCIPHDEWGPVVERCNMRGVEFIGTPFDLAAVDALRDYDAAAIKVASGDITNWVLLDAVRDAGLPVILSTGASNWGEIGAAHNRLMVDSDDVTLLACTLAYPTDLADANLKRIMSLQTFCGGGPVGYSDHTRGVQAAFGAAVLGAVMLEKHCYLPSDGERSGDQLFALTPSLFKLYVERAKEGEAARGNGMLGSLDSEVAARDGARRAVRWRINLMPIMRQDGITLDDVTTLRPCPAEGVESFVVLDQVVGDRRYPLKMDVRAGDIVRAEDFLL